MFERMKEEGVCPHDITFVALLAVCVLNMVVEIGLELFQLNVEWVWGDSNIGGIMGAIDHLAGQDYW